MRAFGKAAVMRSALDAVLGLTPQRTPAQDALAKAQGDLATAFAIRLGVPVAERTDRPTPPRVKPNRAERRATLRRDNPELWRADVRGSYARQLTRKAAP